MLLRNRATGGEFWVVTIHNSPRTQEADRDSATAAEIALFNRLRATGRPVLVTGDMNEKAEWFCKASTGAGMVAANGGSGAGGCVLPPGPLRIDWIMGGGGVDFSGYVQDACDARGDHRPLLRARRRDRHPDRDGRPEGLTPQQTLRSP